VKVKINQKKTVTLNFIGVFFVTLLLSISATSLAICSDVVSYNGERPPKVVYGSAIKSNEGSAAGASVLAQASGLPDETTTVLSSGWWQFDISGDAGHTEWPDGTSFNVTITIDGWEGTKNGVVQGVLTDVGLVILYANKIIADAGGPYNGTICNPVQFSGSAYGGAPPYEYNWYFGDGGSGSGQNPSHQYTADGTYTVTLTVKDDASNTYTDTATVTISTTDLVADAGGPYSGYENDFIDFYGSASGGCSPYSYSWNFGDGETGTGQNPSHIYDGPGTYTVTLTVTDDVGTFDTDTATCTVESTPVVAEAGGPYEGCVGQAVQFSGSASGDAPPFTYNWDFGDGNSGSGQKPTHIYSSAGTYYVILTVTDSNSNSDTDPATATIVDCGDDPIANAGGPYSGVINQAVQFEGSAIGGVSPYSYEWDFGDGGSSTDQNPTHVYTSVGTYDVTLTVTDDDGKTDIDETTATISEGTADLSCAGSLSWKTKSQGTVTDSFSVSNIGDPGTNLDWEIDSYPEWGSWTFTPEQGDDLTPEAGATTVGVTVVAPQEKQEFSGKVKVINKENPSDFCEISVSLTVPKAYNPLLEFLELFAQKMPMLRLVLEILHLI